MQLTPDKIMQTGMAFWNSKALLSAVEMELELSLGLQETRAENGGR